MVTTGHQLIITVVTGIPITLHKKYVYHRPLRLKDSERANRQRVTLQVAHFPIEEDIGTFGHLSVKLKGTPLKPTKYGKPKDA